MSIQLIIFNKQHCTVVITRRIRNNLLCITCQQLIKMHIRCERAERHSERERESERELAQRVRANSNVLTEALTVWLTAA